mgnify:CR=1 FL=1
MVEAGDTKTMHLLRHAIEWSSRVEKLSPMVRRSSAWWGAIVVIVLMATACTSTPKPDGPASSPVATTSSAALAMCRDRGQLDRAQELTTSNLAHIKGHKAWVCWVKPSGQAEGVVPQGPYSDADMRETRKSGILGDTPVPTDADCHVAPGKVYILTDDGQVWWHRIVECGENLS